MTNFIMIILITFLIVTFYLKTTYDVFKVKYPIFIVATIFGILVFKVTIIHALILLIFLDGGYIALDIYSNKKKDDKLLRILHIGYVVYVIIVCNFVISSIASNPSNLLINILIVLIILKPSSLFISRVLEKVFEENTLINNDKEIRVGRYIGYLERVLILILCLLDGIAAIGFVLAVKTVARYPDINDQYNNVFREKYILGTMLSCTIPLIIIYLLKFLNILS